METKLIIAGGRDHELTDSDYLGLASIVANLHVVEVVTGGAPGVDTSAAQWAEKLGLISTVFRAKWYDHGKAAGPMRNTEMLDYVGRGGILVVFRGGRGTANMLRQAKARGIDIVDWRDRDGT